MYDDAEEQFKEFRPSLGLSRDQSIDVEKMLRSKRYAEFAASYRLLHEAEASTNSKIGHVLTSPFNILWREVLGLLGNPPAKQDPHEVWPLLAPLSSHLGKVGGQNKLARYYGELVAEAISVSVPGGATLTEDQTTLLRLRKYTDVHLEKIIATIFDQSGGRVLHGYNSNKRYRYKCPELYPLMLKAGSALMLGNGHGSDSMPDSFSKGFTRLMEQWELASTSTGRLKSDIMHGSRGAHIAWDIFLEDAQEEAARMLLAPPSEWETYIPHFLPKTSKYDAVVEAADKTCSLLQEVGSMAPTLLNFKTPGSLANSDIVTVQGIGTLSPLLIQLNPRGP